ncbi:hypothetical protein [Sphingorhabdus sp. M41]|uniref:hypothetical protein n=1 Tax=Sphingorhabdus sp. M41 TaxID=1806885 RepID=UPI00078C94FA|nr:hypothetical protein [Sphingorhabdus sp. M41]AMO72661.1 hypothetical protein AZE99_13080 [Sphingorhabdus sp. M41]
MSKFAMPRLLKSVVAAGALLSLSGCIYGGAGYYGDGYVNNAGYDCDPYAPFDDYYACDYGYGFANIGYGGGWYDQYYYPGYGIYIFDRGGRRLAMRDNDRRYWARQRATYGGRYFRERHSNPNRHAERRDHRYERGDGVGGQRRSNYRGNDNVRDNRATRDQRSNRPTTRIVRPDSSAQTTQDRNRGDRTGRPDRRPAQAVEQRQARPQPAPPPVQTSRPPRPERPRYSPRTSRSERERISDE